MGLIPTLPPEAKQALSTVFTMSADISAIRNLLERLVELEEAKAGPSTLVKEIGVSHRAMT